MPIMSPEGDDDGDSVDTDSSGEVPGAETCAICLGRMRGEVGSPESCEHTFCLICILEWAKVSGYTSVWIEEQRECFDSLSGGSKDKQKCKKITSIQLNQ